MHHTMKTYVRVGIQIHIILISKLVIVCGQLHALTPLTPRKEVSLDIGKESEWVPEPVWILWRIKSSLSLLGIKLQSFGSPALSQPL
jgi:hypothetical protein